MYNKQTKLLIYGQTEKVESPRRTRKTEQTTCEKLDTWPASKPDIWHTSDQSMCSMKGPSKRLTNSFTAWDMNETSTQHKEI